MVKNFNDINIGVSTWGQNDERLLLWSGEPFQSVLKLLLKGKPDKAIEELIPGRLIEYFSPEFTWSSRLLNGNLKRIINSNLKNLKSFQEQFGKADIIHAHVGFPAGIIAAKLSKDNIPIILSEHASPFPLNSWKNLNRKMKNGLEESYQESILVLCVSESLQKKIRNCGITDTKYIPNLVDESFFKPATQANNNVFTFFTLGRMVPQKGIDILLQAISRLKSDAKFRIGGDGPELKKYKQLAKELNIDEKIVWLGRLDKHQALIEYQNCDAFVLPSRHESMGVVFTEAMACGKPVIATICGGPEEFIDDSIGYMVKNENVDALVKAMERMIENHSNFNSRAIRKKFEDQFSSSVVTRKLRDVYEEVIKLHQSKK